MRRHHKLVLWVVFGILGISMHPRFAIAQTDATLQVSKVDSPGTITVVLNLGVDKKGHKVRRRQNIPVTANETPAEVAAAIQKAFPASSVSGNKVTRRITGGGAGFTIVQTDPTTKKTVIEGVTDTETHFASLPPPNEPLAIFAFEPNPDNGQATLMSDALVSAGFANGLPPVSFIATVGTSLPTLADTLDSALKTGGYLTSMPDATEVLVFAQGISLPAEVDFSVNPLNPLGTVGNEIETGVLSAAVPEPGSLLLLTAWSLALLGYRGWGCRIRWP